MKKLRYLKTVSGGTLSMGTMFIETPQNVVGLKIGSSSSPTVFNTASGENQINAAIYSKYTSSEGYFRGFYSDVVYSPTAVGAGEASVYGVMGKVTMAASTTHVEATDERLVGVDGRFENKGTLAGTGLWVAGTRGNLHGAGTWTDVQFAAGVLAAVQLSCSSVGGGIYAAFVALSTNLPVPDAVLSVHGYFEQFLNLENSGMCFEANGTAKNASTTIGWLKVKTPDGTQGYINVYP